MGVGCRRLLFSMKLFDRGVCGRETKTYLCCDVVGRKVVATGTLAVGARWNFPVCRTSHLGSTKPMYVRHQHKATMRA